MRLSLLRLVYDDLSVSRMYFLLSCIMPWLAISGAQVFNAIHVFKFILTREFKQIKDGFNDGKDLVVSVMSAMGEEQINALKDIGPK